MRRVFLLALCVSGALALTACPSKPKNGECKTSDDCSAQEGYGKTCIEGRCQECGQDTDCKAGFVCRANRCTPRTSQSITCPADMVNVADAFCADKYEASRPDATDLEPGTMGHRSCSNADVLPWTNIKYPDAVTACTNAGEVCESGRQR